MMDVEFMKMTEDEDGNYNGEYTVSMLPEQAQSYIGLGQTRIEEIAISGAIGCESPIEQILGVQLSLSFSNGNVLWQHIGLDFNTLETQHEFIVDRRRYRVDFLITAKDLLDRKKYYSFIIECDGHEFHEKTKEQAAHDKARDRDLAECADLVLHYTGSEIYKWRAIADIGNRICKYVRKQRSK